VKEKQSAMDQQKAAGLCADCIHARRIESARGSLFVLCNLSHTDRRFPKYPRLPILSCDGYSPKEANPSSRLSS
jgi:hypothetical protein